MLTPAADSGDAAPPSDRDAPPAARPNRPAVDEESIDYLARRSLGESPSETELNERRGMAEMLLSAESEEVRDRVERRAARGAE